MKKERFITITGMLLASLVLASFVACGSGTPGSEPTKTAIAPTSTGPPEATSTATSIPPTPTEIPLPVASQVASGTETDAVLIADGKLLFDKTAGNLGCAYCHQSDATGDLEIGSPDIRGVTESQIIDALQTRVQMTFLDLSDYEVSAVAAYLATLDR
jgi:mono/diheme cytochrome c family protein